MYFIEKKGWHHWSSHGFPEPFQIGILLTSVLCLFMDHCILFLTHQFVRNQGKDKGLFHFCLLQQWSSLWALPIQKLSIKKLNRSSGSTPIILLIHHVCVVTLLWFGVGPVSGFLWWLSNLQSSLAFVLTYCSLDIEQNSSFPNNFMKLFKNMQAKIIFVHWWKKKRWLLLFLFNFIFFIRILSVEWSWLLSSLLTRSRCWACSCNEGLKSSTLFIVHSWDLMIGVFLGTLLLCKQTCLQVVSPHLELHFCQSFSAPRCHIQ